MPTTKYERTSPDYPTYGPSDTEDWHSYFKRMKGGDAGFLSDPDEGEPVEPAEEPEVEQLVVEAHEVTADECPNPLKAYAKIAQENGWTYKLCHSQSFTPGVPYKTGAQAGEMRPDRTIDHYWINAHRADKGIISVSYDAENGSVKAYNRNINRQLRVVPDKEMKTWMRS